MPSFNKVVLIGRLTRDPEMRYTTSGLAVCSFTIAVDRRFKSQSGEKQTDFFRCSAWRQSAEFVSNYVTKGKLVAVEGRIEMNKFTGQDGIEKQSADIVCDQVELLESNREQGEGGGGYSGSQSTPAAPRQPAAGGQADSGNGYYPDDEMAVAPNSGAQNRAPRPAQPNANAGGARPAGTAPNRPAGAGAGAPRPAPRPEPAYPENDFDDSDPFSDE